ncbi:MAG: hypothetical protein U1F57_05935 [bacterium]
MGKPSIQKNDSIDLSVYEDSFLLDAWPLDTRVSFGERIRVEEKGPNGTTVTRNLWQAANPTDRFDQDGELTYEEAHGKTFMIPMYFCNNPGWYVYEIRNKQDFKSLKDGLWAPIQNWNHMTLSCDPPSPSAVPAAPQGIRETEESAGNEGSDSDEEPGGIFGDAMAGLVAFATSMTSHPFSEVFGEGIKAAMKEAAGALGNALSEGSACDPDTEDCEEYYDEDEGDDEISF